MSGHNTLSGEPHEKEVKALLGVYEGLHAEQLRHITANNGFIGTFLKSFFERARATAEMGINWVYFNETPEEILYEPTEEFIRKYLTELGYKFSGKCKQNKVYTIVSW